MREYLREFFDEFEYDMADRCAISCAYERIMASMRGGELLLSLLRGYDADTRFIKAEHISELQEIAKVSCVHIQTVILLTVILLSRKMRERLLKLGLTKRIIATTLYDLKWKMEEGKKIHGVVGTEHFDWYTRFLELRLFALGRLQFELRSYQGETVTVGERMIKEGTPVLYTHIPRCGAPLDIKLCNASFKEATKVFSKLLGIEDIPILCSSWLLYPKNRDFLPEDSNIVRFMNRFTVFSVEHCRRDRNSVIPFVFEAKMNTKIEDLPEETSLQRAYKAHLLDGGRMGVGKGILISQ